MSTNASASTVTKLYFKSRLVGTEADEVHLEYDARNALLYKGHPIDTVVAESDAATALLFLISKGNSWQLREVKTPTDIDNGVHTGGVTWVPDSGSDMRMAVVYPNTKGAAITWFLTDKDNPPVALKVVVRRKN